MNIMSLELVLGQRAIIPTSPPRLQDQYKIAVIESLIFCNSTWGNKFARGCIIHMSWLPLSS